MCDILRFSSAREWVLSEEKSAGGIGTLSEKTLHKILKHYIEPDVLNHEVKLLGSVIDVFFGGVAYEIQTRSFERLLPKLRKLLPQYKVCVVCPIAVSKSIRWIDRATGEISEPKKSPKKETPLDAFRNLYRIKEFVKEPNLSVRLIYFEADEYKYLDGWDSTRKKGSSRAERIPTRLCADEIIASVDDYGKYFPDHLTDEFTISEFAKSIKRTQRYAYNILRFFVEVGVVSHVGKRGRAYLYSRILK